MPEGISALVGHIINALAMVGVAALAFMVGKLMRKKSAQMASEGIIAAQMRVHIDQEAKRRQTEIQEALSDDDPAAQLEKLGNRRRGGI